MNTAPPADLAEYRLFRRLGAHAIFAFCKATGQVGDRVNRVPTKRAPYNRGANSTRAAITAECQRRAVANRQARRAA